MLSHPHVVRCHRAAVSLNGRRVCLVMTDLALTPDDPTFNQTVYDSLMGAARAYLAVNPQFEDIRVVRAA